MFGLPPSIDVSVGQRGPSEIPGYDKVPVTLAKGGRSSKHDFLISSDSKTIIEWEKLDISQDINTSGRPERGNKDAKVTIVNYDDFECPFCSRMHQTIFPDLFKIYGNQVRIVYKDYPLIEIHPWAMHAAVDANCLAAQNSDAFWDFADYTHANQKTITGPADHPDINQVFARLDVLTFDLGTKHNLNSNDLQACVKKQDESVVRASLAEGDKLGVDATPTIFVNGEVVSGILSAADLRAIIDKALREAGQVPPSTPSPAAPAKASPSPSGTP
jgi:protein-disulfide isomerase